jgi:hypothetical protein
MSCEECEEDWKDERGAVPLSEWELLLNENVALKARVEDLEGTAKIILDHINHDNDPDRHKGLTDFGISQRRWMTISTIKHLAEEALR